MIEILVKPRGVSNYTRIQIPDTAGTWEATEALQKAAWTVDCLTRWPEAVSNPNNIIDLQMARAIWLMHVEPILEFRQRIEL